MKYINSKKDLKSFLKYESEKYGLKKSCYPIFGFSEVKILYKFNYLLRHLEYYTNCNFFVRKMFTKFLFTMYCRKYFIHISPNSFDMGLMLVHIGSRLVNKKACIGKNCTMHINTCIVAGGVNDDVPIIGDNCILGVGSIILGKARLGDNVAVGAGAVVNKDFSSGNMTIAGVPAKKISEKTRNDWSKENRSKNNVK